MNIFARLGRGLTGILFLCYTGLAFGQWQIDTERSSIDFISIKNGGVAEQHRFSGLTGGIEKDGVVRVSIPLDKVETGIDIRDERMRESLFETDRFATASVVGRVNPGVLLLASGGAAVKSPVELKLTLHGVGLDLKVPVTAMGEKNGRLHVVSTRPVILRAADFGLETGIEALRKIAGLDAIATAVPVTVNLVLNPVKQ